MLMSQCLLQPCGYRAGWNGSLSLSTRRKRERVHASVRHIEVAVSAGNAFAALRTHIVDLAGAHHARIKLSVATDAVVHDDLRAGVLCDDRPMLAVGDKIGNVLHAVKAFEEIFRRQRGVRNMAVVARCIASMGGM